MSVQSTTRKTLLLAGVFAVSASTALYAQDAQPSPQQDAAPGKVS